MQLEASGDAVEGGAACANLEEADRDGHRIRGDRSGLLGGRDPQPLCGTQHCAIAVAQRGDEPIGRGERGCIALAGVR